MMKQIQKGFTLIELMIVVAIIGILAAVAIPAYQDYIVKAKLSRVQSTIDPIKLALALYYQENGSFPNATVDSATASVIGPPPNLWGSIGIADGAFVNIPTEVQTLEVDGSTGSGADPVYVLITLTMKAIKATTIDTLDLVLRGTPGGTAINWTCDAATTVTDSIAKKYFACP